jgi:glyoxylase-like metal-dependent hydrolase (beta-lactamase superfamily II)
MLLPMIEITGLEQASAWRDGVLPPVERLRPGLWSIPVPLPNPVLRYVLVYLLELPDGVAVIDVGWDTAEAWAALTKGITQTGHDVADVKAILVTHVHLDHYGLAERVRAASGAWIGMHEAEAATLFRRRGRRVAIVERSRAWLLRCGVPAAELDDLVGSPDRFDPLIAMPEPDRLLGHGDKIDLPDWDLRAAWTPGHTPGHLCFYEQNTAVLFTGDHILPRISPNISLQSTTPGNPLGQYLDSLAATGEVAADEVLPAHEYRFRGLAERIGQLRLHHRERLAELLGLIRSGPGQTTWDLATSLSWSRSWAEIRGIMRRSALGETLAHLVLLESNGQVTRSAAVPDRWHATGLAPVGWSAGRAGDSG